MGAPRPPSSASSPASLAPGPAAIAPPPARPRGPRVSSEPPPASRRPALPPRPAPLPFGPAQTRRRRASLSAAPTAGHEPRESPRRAGDQGVGRPSFATAVAGPAREPVGVDGRGPANGPSRTRPIPRPGPPGPPSPLLAGRRGVVSATLAESGARPAAEVPLARAPRPDT